VHVVQLSVEPVTADQAAVGFEPGSDHSTLSNYYARLDGGRDVVVASGVDVVAGDGAIDG
jgi:hypothetical protein